MPIGTFSAGRRHQDCVFHKINRLYRHAGSKKRGKKMMQEASAAFVNPSLRNQQRALAAFCNKWRPHEPYAIKCFAERLDKCFEVYALPESLRSKASTSGACETLALLNHHVRLIAMSLR